MSEPGQPGPYEEFDVVVVGGGPVGMTLGNLLGTYGTRTLVLERDEDVHGLPRAVGTDYDCLRAWQAAGLDDRLLADMLPSGADGMGMLYLDPRDRPFLEVRPTGRPYGFAEGYGFIQPLVDRVLRDGLDRFECVGFRAGHEVQALEESDQSVVVRGQDGRGRPFAIRARFVVGCDGGRSRVRHARGIRMQGARFAQRWLVLDTLEPDGPGRNIRDVQIWCDAERPRVCIPRLHGHRRWEFLAHDDERDEELLEPRTIRRLLERYGSEASEQVVVTRRVVHTFRALRAESFRSGRVLLAGDAAHVTPPFAGQGLAIGIRDAFDLAWKLARVATGASAQALLDSYETERRPHAWASIRLALRLGLLMTPRSSLRAAIVPPLVRLSMRWPALREFVREAGPKPAPRYREGCFVAGRGSRAGRMLPQPEVRDAQGRRTKLDRLLGRGFAVLGFGVDPATCLRPERLVPLAAPDLRCLRVRASSDDTRDADSISDGEDRLSAWLGGAGERIVVVRPDRYVAADCRPAEADAVLGRLARKLAAEGP